MAIAIGMFAFFLGVACGAVCRDELTARVEKRRKAAEKRWITEHRERVKLINRVDELEGANAWLRAERSRNNVKGLVCYDER